jgi:hypothetical protein
LVGLATEYYKSLFGPGVGNVYEIYPHLWEEEEKVSIEENEELIKPFLEEEIKAALFQMEKNKAAGPDGLPIEFYQCCWEIIRADLVELFDEFHKWNMDIKRINFGIITLLPKVKEPDRIQQFRHICLLNCLFKLFTKCLTIRLEPITDRIIHKAHTT